jgi:hypothetical protein
MMAPSSDALRAQTYFDDVAPRVGITRGALRSEIVCWPDLGSGSAWGDYDNDGDIDLYVTNQGGPCYLYRNEGDTDGDRLPDFTETAAAAGVANETGVGHSCVFIDVDNDGDQDLFVTNWGSNVLFRNQLMETGSPTFVDITDTAGLTDSGRTITSAWGDYDGDGYLDVYLAKHMYCTHDPQSEDQLYRNNGDGTFTNVTGLLCPGGMAPCAKTSGLAFSAGWFDYDNDADPDLYLANDAITFLNYQNVLWRNDGPDGSGGWIFTDVSTESGTGKRENSMGLGIGDYDNNGFMDIAFSNIGPNVLLRNNGDGTFDDVSEVAGIEREFTPSGRRSVTWGTVFFDYNNDQLADLMIVAGTITPPSVSQPDILFENNGDGTFADISAASGLDDTLRGRSASIVDFDHDGFVDLFVGNLYYDAAQGDTAPFRLFHNRGRELGNTHGWLTVTVSGTRSNRDGIGTRVYLTTPDGVTQIRDITSGPTYGGGDYRAAFFGLGENTDAELSVRWPDGTLEILGSVSANQEIHLIEGFHTPPDRVRLVHPEDRSAVPPGPVTLTWRITEPQVDAYSLEFGTDSMFTVVIIDSVLSDTVVNVDGIEAGQIYWWRVRAHNAGGWGPFSNAWSFSSLLTAVDGYAIVEQTRLRDTYPNPFNPVAHITFEVPILSAVSLTIHNLLGEEVATLLQGEISSGTYRVSWDASNQSSGVYFCRLHVSPLGKDTGAFIHGHFVGTRKLVLVK